MTTTTRRRTQQITAISSRGYVAIRCDYIAAETTMLRCAAKQDMEINGTCGATVEIKAGQEFYLVRAASLGDNMFYIVLLGIAGAKKCSCSSAKPCRHELAVQEREEQRSLALQAKPGVVRREVVSAAPSSRQSNAMIAAPLNGQRGFSLLR